MEKKGIKYWFTVSRNFERDVVFPKLSGTLSELGYSVIDNNLCFHGSRNIEFCSETEISKEHQAIIRSRCGISGIIETDLGYVPKKKRPGKTYTNRLDQITFQS